MWLYVYVNILNDGIRSDLYFSGGVFCFVYYGEYCIMQTQTHRRASISLWTSKKTSQYFFGNQKTCIVLNIKKVIKASKRENCRRCQINHLIIFKIDESSSKQELSDLKWSGAAVKFLTLREKERDNSDWHDKSYREYTADANMYLEYRLCKQNQSHCRRQVNTSIIANMKFHFQY